jgi:archaemetzincin
VNGIAITRLGSVGDDVMDVVVRTIIDSLDAKPVVLDFVWPVEHAYSTARNQYDSFILLRDLMKIQPADSSRVLGVTNCDLFVPALSFVFGQAQLGGPAALMSTARLAPEFHGLPPQHELLMERTVKTVLHEMGHTFGLVHCSNPQCAMALATGLAQLDAKMARYCANCWPRTQGILT